MCVDRNVSRGFATERRFLRSVFQEVARHPVVLAGTGQVLDRFSPIATVQLCSTLA